jgi:chemotaxis response regulator CheB
MHNGEGEPESMQPKGKSVLVVDDSQLVRRTVCSALASDGFDDCGEANDTQEAIELAGKLSPDLIVLDFTACPTRGPLAKKRQPSQYRGR